MRLYSPHHKAFCVYLHNLYMSIFDNSIRSISLRFRILLSGKYRWRYTWRILKKIIEERVVIINQYYVFLFYIKFTWTVNHVQRIYYCWLFYFSLNSDFKAVNRNYMIVKKLLTLLQGFLKYISKVVSLWSPRGFLGGFSWVATVHRFLDSHEPVLCTSCAWTWFLIFYNDSSTLNLFVLNWLIMNISLLF